MLTLIELCTKALAEALLRDAESVKVSEIPEPELVLALWHQCELLLPYAKGSWERVLSAFSSCWRLERLNVSCTMINNLYPHLLLTAQLQHLALVGEHLKHLDICSAPNTTLDWLSGVPNLSCLLLQGWNRLSSNALSSLSQVPKLRALHLNSCRLLDDSSAAPFVAAIPRLEVLNFSYTKLGDITIRALAHGPRLDNPAGSMAKDPPVVSWLQACGSAVTPGCLEDLKRLPALKFLDLRRTQVSRRELLPLQHLRGLQPAQGAWLVASAAISAAYEQQRIMCCCDTTKDACGLEAWARNAVHELVTGEVPVKSLQDPPCSGSWYHGRAGGGTKSRSFPVSTAKQGASDAQVQRATAAWASCQQPDPASCRDRSQDPSAGTQNVSPGPSRAQQHDDASCIQQVCLQGRRSTAAQEASTVAAAFAPMHMDVEHRKRKRREEVIPEDIEEGDAIRRGRPPATRKNLGSSFVDWQQWVSRHKTANKH